MTNETVEVDVDLVVAWLAATGEHDATATAQAVAAARGATLSSASSRDRVLLLTALLTTSMDSDLADAIRCVKTGSPGSWDAMGHVMRESTRGFRSSVDEVPVPEDHPTPGFKVCWVVVWPGGGCDYAVTRDWAVQLMTAGDPYDGDTDGPAAVMIPVAVPESYYEGYGTAAWEGHPVGDYAMDVIRGMLPQLVAIGVVPPEPPEPEPTVTIHVVTAASDGVAAMEWDRDPAAAWQRLIPCIAPGDDIQYRTVEFPRSQFEAAMQQADPDVITDWLRGGF